MLIGVFRDFAPVTKVCQFGLHFVSVGSSDHCDRVEQWLLGYARTGTALPNVVLELRHLFLDKVDVLPDIGRPAESVVPLCWIPADPPRIESVKAVPAGPRSRVSEAGLYLFVKGVDVGAASNARGERVSVAVDRFSWDAWLRVGVKPFDEYDQTVEAQRLIDAIEHSLVCLGHGGKSL